MDFRVLNSKDPTGEKAEDLLRSGHKYQLTAKQKRIEEKNNNRQSKNNTTLPSQQHHFDSLRSNRNKRHEVEKYKEAQVVRAEEELDRAYEEKLAARNLPMVRKTEKNRLKRQKRKNK